MVGRPNVYYPVEGTPRRDLVRGQPSDRSRPSSRRKARSPRNPKMESTRKERIEYVARALKVEKHRASTQGGPKQGRRALFIEGNHRVCRLHVVFVIRAYSGLLVRNARPVKGTD